MKYASIRFSLSGRLSHGIGPVEVLNTVDSWESVMGERENLRVEPRWRITSPRLLDLVASIIGGGRGIFGEVVRCEFKDSRRTLGQLSTSSLLWRKEARSASPIPPYLYAA